MKNKKILSVLVSLTMTAGILFSFTGCTKDNSISNSVLDSSSIIDEVKSSYTFDFTTELIKNSDGVKINVYQNRPIIFDYKEVNYTDIINYKSPYDKYLNNCYIVNSKGAGYSYEAAILAIKYAFENGVQTVQFPLEYDTATIYDALDFVSAAYPDIPYTFSGINVTNDEEKGYVTLSISDTMIAASSHSDEVIKVAEEIIDGIPDDCQTDVQKAKYIYKWVTENIAFDEYINNDPNLWTVNNKPFTLYGALVEKRAVCDGIASSVQLLFNMAGIECGKVDGNSENGDIGHVWNYAITDGECWDYDATWDIHRYYTDDSDIISEDNTSRYPQDIYTYFGFRRETKNGYSLSQISLQATKNQKFISENSPCITNFNFVIGIDESGKYVYYLNGEIIDDRENYMTYTANQLADNKNVSFYNDVGSYDFINFIVYFTHHDKLIDDKENTQLFKLFDADDRIVVIGKY